MLSSDSAYWTVTARHATCLLLAAPPFFRFLCRCKGLWTVIAQIIFDYMISIDLRTWGEREPCPWGSLCCDIAQILSM